MRISGALIVATALILSACTGVRPFPAPAPELTETAIVPGFERTRFHSLDQEEVNTLVGEIIAQVSERAKAEGKVPNNGLYDILVLSGGGPDGAFGAGLLNGWTAHGDRPEFSLVTGISTGALIAPFAFLGPDYDDELKRFYTQTGTADLVSVAVFKGILGAAGLTDTTPIRAILEREITPDFVAKIAEEHRKGRRLWIGTTNLDSQRPVVWDIGAMAATGRADAPALIREVLLASASIPGAFPPVIFQVEANGKRFSEMHVDGGVTRQLFLFPIDSKVTDRERSENEPMRPRHGLCHSQLEAWPRICRDGARDCSDRTALGLDPDQGGGDQRYRGDATAGPRRRFRGENRGSAGQFRRALDRAFRCRVYADPL